MDVSNENIFTLIGLITIKFSRLDYLTLEYISILIRGYVSVENNIIFQDSTLEKKIQTLEKLISLKHNGNFETMQLEFIKHLKSLKDKRNSFIHGAWNLPESQNIDEIKSLSVKQYKYKLSRPKNRIITKIWEPGKNEEFTKSKLIAFLTDIETTTNDLLQIMAENVRILGNN